MCESSDDFTTEQMSDFYAYVFKTIFYIFAAVTAIFGNKTQKGGMLYETDYAIIRYDNEDDVTTSLTKHKFSVTRLSTTGGFLKKGNTTLMIVTEPERVDEAIDIIKKECGHHQKITINMPYVSGSSMVHCATMPMSVDVGGATIFVVDVERYEKI